MQRVWNLMFTFVELVHLAILTHHHYSNIHNNIDNNNNNNTVSATHTQKEVYFFSLLQQKWHHVQQFCILLSKQYTQFKRRPCALTFYSWKVWGELSTTGVGNLGLCLPPISLDSHQSQIKQDEILDWPHILISLKDNSSFGWKRVISVSHFSIKAEWLGAPKNYKPMYVLPSWETNLNLCGYSLLC